MTRFSWEKDPEKIAESRFATLAQFLNKNLTDSEYRYRFDCHGGGIYKDYLEYNVVSLIYFRVTFSVSR